jgi:hypothetical protein
LLPIVHSFANNPSALHHIDSNWRQQSSFDLPLTSQQNRGSFREAIFFSHEKQKKQNQLNF